MLLSLLNEEINERDYLYLNNIVVLYKDLPSKIYGFIFQYKGKNIITINKKISEEKKKKTIIHEFAHLELNHLEKNKELVKFKVENIEDEADRYMKFLIDSVISKGVKKNKWYLLLLFVYHLFIL